MSHAPEAVISPLRVSDQEREHTAALLREHLMAGRLTVGEFEERMAEAWGARFSEDLWRALRELPVPVPPPAGPPPRRAGHAGVAALACGILAGWLLVLTFGFLWPLALPLGTVAWALGRSARRRGEARGPALAGEVLGALVTGISLLWVTGCAIVLA